MLFDTHCHLNFQAFNDILDEAITGAVKAKIGHIVVPGTDIETSQKALDIALNKGLSLNIYAAVGIHPHHVFKYQTENIKQDRIDKELQVIEKLLQNPKVVAVGEVGVDRFYYQNTKYKNYSVSEEFIALQIKVLTEQIKLAKKYRKSLILHNRQATKDLLQVLSRTWDSVLEGKVVFHCFEADERLLDFARKQHIYIGIDGDLTWSKRKQHFIKAVPLELLVLETDAPYLTPEPIRKEKKFPNLPENITFVRDLLAEIKGVSKEQITKITTQNAKFLFNLLSREG